MRSMRVLWGMLYVKVSISLRVSVAFEACPQKVDGSRKLLVFASWGMNRAGCAGVDAGALDTVFRAVMERRTQLGMRDNIIMQAHWIQCAGIVGDAPRFAYGMNLMRRSRAVCSSCVMHCRSLRGVLATLCDMRRKRWDAWVLTSHQRL